MTQRGQFRMAFDTLAMLAGWKAAAAPCENGVFGPSP